MTQDAFNLNAFLQASEYLRQNLALDVSGARAGAARKPRKRLRAAKSQLSGDLAQLSDEEFARRGFRKIARRADTPRKGARLWLMDTAVVE